MTNKEKCPLCGTDLEETSLPFDWKHCPDCNYTHRPEGDMEDLGLMGQRQMIFVIAEILADIADNIKNINKDDEIEEMLSEIERAKSILKRIQEESNPFETEEEPTYPSPNPFKKKPTKKRYKPPKPGDTYWQETYTKQSDSDSFLSSGNYSTSERLDSLEEIIKGKTTND